MSSVDEVVQQATAAAVYRNLRIGVLAAMETGNVDRARLLLTEVGDKYPDMVPSVKADVRETYGIVI